MEIVRLMHLSL